MTRHIDKVDDLQCHTKKPILKVIREKCLDCCAGQHCEVRLCHIKDCPLWPYRMGKNPFHLRTTTKKQREIAKSQFRINKNKEKQHS